MDSRRSTRRSVNPPETEGKTDSNGSSHPLSDVESILDEIECLVAGGGPEETAKPTPVVGNEVQPDNTGSFEELTFESDGHHQDITRLRADLDAAVATELDLLEERGTDEPGPSPERFGTDAEDSGLVEDEAPKVVIGSDSAAETPLVDPGNDDLRWHLRILSASSRPISRLSRSSRMVVSLFAVSTALWVPLVWMLAFMTNPTEGSLRGSELEDRTVARASEWVPAGKEPDDHANQPETPVE